MLVDGLQGRSLQKRRYTPLVTLHLNTLDYSIVAAYFLVILLIGLRLRRSNNTSKQFFEAGRSLPLAITGIAFVAANSGSLEVMGMVSTSAKYGWRAVHFYWIGAVPAMLFLGLMMMPIYYRSKVRSVPEFLKLRFGEPTRVFNALSFAVLTVMVSGSRTVRDGADPASDLWLELSAGDGALGGVCTCLHPAGRVAGHDV